MLSCLSCGPQGCVLNDGLMVVAGRFGHSGNSAIQFFVRGSKLHRCNHRHFIFYFAGTLVVLVRFRSLLPLHCGTRFDFSCVPCRFACLFYVLLLFQGKKACKVVKSERQCHFSALWIIWSVFLGDSAVFLSGVFSANFCASNRFSYGSWVASLCCWYS